MANQLRRREAKLGKDASGSLPPSRFCQVTYHGDYFTARYGVGEEYGTVKRLDSVVLEDALIEAGRLASLPYYQIDVASDDVPVKED